MGVKGAMSYNGTDGTLLSVNATLTPMLSGGSCDKPAPCDMEVGLPAAIPSPVGATSGVYVNGYKMLASGMEFGDITLAGDCGSINIDCLPDAVKVEIPEAICSGTVLVEGAGAALPEIEFEITVGVETELFTLTTDVVITV